MTDQTNAAPAASEAAPVISAPNLESGESYTAEQAFEAYQKRNSPAEAAEAPAGTESAEADAAPEGTTAEDKGNEPDLPAIDPPKSWSKDAHERWSKLDRETQEFLASRDSEDQKAIKRNLQEAADARKAAEAERKTAVEAKQKYDSQLPLLMRELESVNQAQFSDIKSMEDVVRLQAEDPFRFQAWQVHQMRMQAVKHEADKAEEQKSQERQSKRAAYEAEQNKLLIDLVPEMADPKKSVEIREKAVAMLTDDLGLKIDQLQRWMADDTGHEILSNAGIQQMIADRLKFKELKAAPAKAIPAPVPTVQKPGVGRAPGAASADAIQATRQKLNSTGSMEDAYALYQARKSRAR